MISVDLKIGNVEPRPSYVRSLPVGLSPCVCCTFSNAFGLCKYIKEVYTCLLGLWSVIRCKALWLTGMTFDWKPLQNVQLRSEIRRFKHWSKKSSICKIRGVPRQKRNMANMSFFYLTKECQHLHWQFYLYFGSCQFCTYVARIWERYLEFARQAWPRLTEERDQDDHHGQFWCWCQY